jgi:pilus assembly protein CpaB
VRTSTIVMIAFAVLFGVLAVFVAQSWLNSQAEMRMKSLEAQKKPLTTKTIVVASRSLRFGNELSKLSLREIAWPSGAVPAGSFGNIDELLNTGKRVVLTTIETNEPILASKITGPGQRATLSAVLGDGMKAVTIRVNDVEGVAGFVLPGDHVDIVLTRQVEKGKANNDVVLQNAKVLAIDQTADERAEKPSVVKAVTLEVDTVDAQKLALAGTIGTLSLLLRKAGETAAHTTRRVTIADLGRAAQPEPKDTRFVTVGVIRGAAQKTLYSVPVEGAGPQAMASAGRRQVQN